MGAGRAANGLTSTVPTFGVDGGRVRDRGWRTVLALLEGAAFPVGCADGLEHVPVDGFAVRPGDQLEARELIESETEDAAGGRRARSRRCDASSPPSRWRCVRRTSLGARCASSGASHVLLTLRLVTTAVSMRSPISGEARAHPRRATARGLRHGRLRPALAFVDRRSRAGVVRPRRMTPALGPLVCSRSSSAHRFVPIA
jgi:hypothetical protein